MMTNYFKLLLLIGSLLLGVRESISASYIINIYTAVEKYEYCNNELIVKSQIGYKIGDTILLIQMKGASIDSSNTSVFGSIKAYNSSGNFEFNYIKSISGNKIGLRNTLLHEYDYTNGRVQMISVPYYTNLDIKDKLTCLDWNGSIGGVLVFNVKNTLTLHNDIDVSGKGFRGGIMKNSSATLSNCFENNYFYPLGTILAAGKGESIVEISRDKAAGKGHLGAGGGGGMDHNSGGGGGANGGVGGFGGLQFVGCNDNNFDNRGLGGQALNLIAGKVFLGSGGGAGHCNNGFINPTNKYDYNGGNGGGIIMFSSINLVTNGFKILASGDSAFEINSNLSTTHDGMGGGGSGGSILIANENFQDNTMIKCNGGKGGDMHAFDLGQVGPGGGGGGGVVWIPQGTLPGNVNVDVSGGRNGIVLQKSDPWGATPGEIGQIKGQLILPFSGIPFKKNIESNSIDTLKLGCNRYNLNAQVKTNIKGISQWQWSFGDGTIGSGEKLLHTYNSSGSFNLKLLVTDSLGCMDSLSSVIFVSSINSTITKSLSICQGKSIQLQASGGDHYQWTPSTGLDNPGISGPIATPQMTTTYLVNIMNDLINCSKIDSLTITVKPKPDFNIGASSSTVCLNDTFQLFGSGGQSYNWSPGKGMDDSTISNPKVKALKSTDYKVRIISKECMDTVDIVKNIQVNPLPEVKISLSNDISCTNPTARLNAFGGVEYMWSPVSGLSNPSISNPIVNLNGPMTYTLKVLSSSGCTKTDSIRINIKSEGDNMIFIPNIFSPNQDGLNDCFKLYTRMDISLDEFSVFNRWGDHVFSTRDPSSCWDGTFKGVIQPVGVYVYFVKGSSTCGDIFRKGSVLLER